MTTPRQSALSPARGWRGRHPSRGIAPISLRGSPKILPPGLIVIVIIVNAVDHPGLLAGPAGVFARSLEEAVSDDMNLHLIVSSFHCYDSIEPSNRTPGSAGECHTELRVEEVRGIDSLLQILKLTIGAGIIVVVIDDLWLRHVDVAERTPEEPSFVAGAEGGVDDLLHLVLKVFRFRQSIFLVE